MNLNVQLVPSTFQGENLSSHTNSSEWVYTSTVCDGLPRSPVASDGLQQSLVVSAGLCRSPAVSTGLCWYWYQQRPVETTGDH